MKADSPLVAALAPSPNFGNRRGRAVDALVLHYTGMCDGRAARARLLDADAQVSAHYLVWEDGHIEQMVAEADRAWHAGRAFWAGESDVNALSIGIEIVNGGHDFGCPPYPEAQIAAVGRLAADVCRRHAVPAHRVLAHSDVAPDRKMDPGEWFPWDRLAAGGVGCWSDREDASEPLDPSGHGPVIESLQARLAAYGYLCPASGRYDAATRQAVTAFQRHFRPDKVDGMADATTLARLDHLLSIRPRRR